MDIYFSLIIATLILVLIPGPNVAVIVAMSLERGTRSGLLAVCGTTIGVGLQLVLVVGGLSALIDLAVVSFGWLRWIGVVYLAYLGVRALSAPQTELTVEHSPRGSDKLVFWGAGVVALFNPKTLLFNAAFLPQFVVSGSGSNVLHEFTIVAIVFLSVLAMGDCIWVIAATYSRRFLMRFGRLHNYLTGLVYLGASFALALSRR